MTITVTTTDVASNFTFASLQTKIADWLHRQDLTNVIPDFIAIGEQKMNQDLECRDMETNTTISILSGTTRAATPTDMLEVRRFKLTTSPYTSLNYVSPEKLAMTYDASSGGAPVEFTVSGGYFEFGPVPDGNYDAELIYFQKIPPLSTTNTSNWLLNKWPYIYLYASLLASAPYLRDDNRVPVWEREYKKMVDTINGIDWFSGASMVVRRV